MKECEFEYNEQTGVYRCMVCGREIKAPKDSIVSAYCKIQPVEAEPSLIKKAAHYAAAVVQHYTTGAKIREDAEVKVILEICKSCPIRFAWKVNTVQPGNGNYCHQPF